MDWQRVKEKVTAEVIRQLQADGTAASPEKVQQLVVAALGAASAPAPDVVAVAEPRGMAAPCPTNCAAGPVADLDPRLPACAVGADFKTDLLIVVAGPVCDKVIAAIKTLAVSRQVTVVTGGDSSRLAQVQACSQVLGGEPSETLARRLVQGAGTIVVPVITTSVAAKAAGLIGDCLGSAVLVQAALAGKRVIIARESLAAPVDATWSTRRKVDEVIETLKTLGFAITNLQGLVPEVERAIGGKSGSGGYVPAYQPHPAVLASRLTVAENAAKAFALPGSAPLPAQGDYDWDLARIIDHTLLKPEATVEQIKKLCKEALEYGFWSVCVNPTWVTLCAKLLQNSKVKVCTVIGFPLGATSSASKAAEAAEAVRGGATEVDMVMNVGALKSGQHDVVLEDMKAVAKAAKPRALVKVILETGLLTNEEKVKACELAAQAGLDFVKTSTGFGPGGATAADIALMRKTVGPNMGVKASGGIRDFETAQAMATAGASRIGASASVNIVKRVKPQVQKDKY